MTRLHGCTLALLFVAPAASALAATIPYPNPGTIAPQVSTFAQTSGGVSVYYYGSTAGFEDQVEILDVQTGYNSGPILDNKSTTVGAEVSVGTMPGQINANDQLVFYIVSPDGLFASIASYSADGVNHAYITSYPGGILNGTTVPMGLFVGLEDLPNGASDFNYNDDDFIFTGVSAPAVMGSTPEPESLALFGTGLLGMVGVARRRVRA